MAAENTRNNIIRSAQKLFAKKGFDDTTILNIASEASCAKGTVYLYFKNKDDIFGAICKNFFDVQLNNYSNLKAFDQHVFTSEIKNLTLALRKKGLHLLFLSKTLENNQMVLENYAKFVRDEKEILEEKLRLGPSLGQSVGTLSSDISNLQKKVHSCLFVPSFVENTWNDSQMTRSFEFSSNQGII